MNDSSSDSDATRVLETVSGPTRTAILQIHPSLRCNLSCTHCYSVSGPTARKEIEAGTICELVSDAATMGYRVLSVSGGEPLMYPGLDKVLAHAKSVGFYTTVTTNGFFARQQRLTSLRGLVDLLAISLDGPPEIHNRIRGSALAFDRLQEAVKNVRQALIPFGFIHTVTRENWEHLLWVAKFAGGCGASLLQIHPLELAGRAESQMVGDAPENDVLAKVYVLAFALASRYAGTMRVQLDVLYIDHLRDEPDLVYAGESEENLDHIVPAQLLGLLVLEPDGTVVPISYGFSRHYKVCNVKEQRLTDAWSEYLVKGYPVFKALCRRVWDELIAPRAPLLSNWHEVIVSRSCAIG